MDIVKHYDKVLKRALFLKDNINDAKDLVQDTYEKALNNLDKYDKEKGTIYTWLVRIMYNLNVSRHRIVKRIKPVLFSTNDTQQKAENIKDKSKGLTIDTSIETLIYELIKSRKSNSIQSLVLFCEGVTYKAIAKKQGVSMTALKSRIRRGKKQAKELLETTVYLTHLKRLGYVKRGL